MKNIIDFLTELQNNNNRDWFHANKQRYDDVRKEFLQIIAEIISGISEFDENIRQVRPEDCVFRIYRDTRFSKDKSPYKNNFGAFISKEGFKSRHSGYYFHLQPGDYFISAGIYMPPAEFLRKIRNEIYYHYENFLSIIEHPDYQHYEIKFYEDKLKRPPKGYSTDFKGIEWLKYKSYVPFCELQEKELFSENVIDKIISLCRIMYPLNQFIEHALL